MPAVTVDDILSLPRLITPTPGALSRPVRSLTNAPSGYEGEGFPVRRAFAGVADHLLDSCRIRDRFAALQRVPPHAPTVWVVDGRSRW